MPTYRAETYSGNIEKSVDRFVMEHRSCIVFLVLMMTIDLGSSHGLDSRDRRMPPPVMSLLEKLRSLRTQGSPRVVRDVTDEDLATGNNLPERVLSNQIEDVPQGSQPPLRQKRYVSTMSMRGCHLGTCQIQNLASMLYRLGNNSFKDGSNKDTKDPLGYGRRRRSLKQNPKRTELSRLLLAT